MSNESQRRESAAGRAFLALRAALYATCFVVLWGWLAVTVQPLDGYLGGALPRWWRPVGALFALPGGALALSCIWMFVRAGRGTPAPFDAPRSFVAAGPYRWVRNPMYVGAFGLLAGAGLWFRSPAVVLLAGVGVLLAHLFVVAYEEPTLGRRFGRTYDDYRSRVNRWIPRPPGG